MANNGALYKTYQLFYDYYLDYDYADKWVSAAFSGTDMAFTSGKHSPNNFAVLGDAARIEAVKKGTAYMHVWMYAIGEFENAIDDCETCKAGVTASPPAPCSDSCTDVVGPFANNPAVPTCAAASVAPGLPFGSLCDGNWPASVTCQQTCADVGHNYADPPCCTSRPPAAPAPSPPRYTDPSPPPIPPPSRIMFKEPEEYSCEKMRPWSGTSENCTCKDGTCTLNVTLSFGDAEILFENSGLKVNGQPVDRFHMLGFNGQSPGPTIRVHAGDTLRILLKNNLSPELVNTSSVPNNHFRQFDVVNLHTHGLHVSPLAPGDDVVNTSVPAGEEHQYVYHIPEDHMGGTHWCKRPPQHSNLCAGPTPICRSRADPVFAHRALSDHAHWHGAVSIHVNFGGAGMIIVEDAVNQLPAELVDVVHGGPVEDYIVAAYHVDFKKINGIKDGVASFTTNQPPPLDRPSACAPDPPTPSP